MDWNDSVLTLKGVGPKRGKALQEHQIETVGNLLSFYPKKYIDRNVLGSLDEFTENQVLTVKALVLGSGRLQRIRGNLSIFTMPLLLDEVKITAVFFNQPYLKGVLEENQEYYFYGKTEKNGEKFKLMNPQFAPANNPGRFFELTPVYSKIQGIPNDTIRKMLVQIFSGEPKIEDGLPESIRKSYRLPTMAAALAAIHFPKTMAEVTIGKERLKFNEALKINMGILSNAGESKFSNISINTFDGTKALINNLPYELTQSQKMVVDDILADLRNGHVMNRLVQGDVGSGKTVIAIISACLMAQNGYQTAYMAPTEILAQQHGRSFNTLLKDSGVSVEIITGSLKTQKRREILERVANGETAVVIGTHALFQDSVDYYNLGLVITDEQHRFGVKQRGRLSLKGNQPHTMVMSATPIPRTLALILYGDLAVSYIDELPKGRKPIKTYCYDEASLHKIFSFLEIEMKKGRQAFVICPFIEASEEMAEVNDIESVYSDIEKHFLGKYQTGFLHSRLGNDEKEEIIKAFNLGTIKLLVATSIIEVGIDVPNVSVMAILSAERFGLSQLHQLRGRVGRGEHQSFCFLVTNSKSPETLARMEVIVKNRSGKKIADEDYRLRGPGDYFGLKQHGLPDFGILNPMEDMLLIQETRELAETIFNSAKKDMMIYREKVLKTFFREVAEISLN